MTDHDNAHDLYMEALAGAGLIARRIECPECHGRGDDQSGCDFCGGAGSVYAIERAVSCPGCPHDGTCTEDFAAGCGAYAGECKRKDGAA